MYLIILKNLQNNREIVVNIHSYFLKKTITKVAEINWVDLENDYFEQLLEYKELRGFNWGLVEQLNTEFEYLKLQLEQYLIRHQKESKLTYSEDFTKLFGENIKEDEIVTVKIKDHYPEKILLLSFNYTSTLKKYKEDCLILKQINTQLNYIHGKVGLQSNPLIFGFGDEYNKDYLEFENLRNNELLKHIKSFGYFKTSNYHNLIRFIDIKQFQVYIFGHSLGLSDRTMLKQIFEHKNCKSIKIFYHQNDYTEKTFDITRHFSDKGLMRKKIIPFNLSSPMPQLNKTIQSFTYYYNSIKAGYRYKPYK